MYPVPLLLATILVVVGRSVGWPEHAASGLRVHDSGYLETRGELVRPAATSLTSQTLPDQSPQGVARDFGIPVGSILAGLGHGRGIVLIDGLPQKGLMVYVIQRNGSRHRCLYGVRTTATGAWFAPNLQPGTYQVGSECESGEFYYLAGNSPDTNEVRADHVSDFGVRYWREKQNPPK